MTINCRGQLLSLSSPVVMGILNLTPDSFYDGGKLTGLDAALAQAEKHLSEGATILDIGGMSSRPGAEIIDPQEEQERVLPVVKVLVKQFPKALLSIDTLHSAVANACLHEGAHLINDISAARYNSDMAATVARHKAPIIIMHMQGMPATMQQNPHYNNVVTEVAAFLGERITALQQSGINDIIIDPGFGFGKTLQHNYTLLNNLHYFTHLHVPLLAGISRKGMLYRLLGTTADEALNATTVANTMALMNGANILRVHDVKPAMEAVKLFNAYSGLI